MRATPRGAIAIARKNPPGPVTCDVTQNMKYAPSIYSAPWAKFKMLSTPKIRVSPDDMRNRNAASRRADKTCTVTKEMSRKPVMPLLREKRDAGRPVRTALSPVPDYLFASWAFFHSSIE